MCVSLVILKSFACSDWRALACLSSPFRLLKTGERAERDLALSHNLLLKQFICCVIWFGNVKKWYFYQDTDVATNTEVTSSPFGGSEQNFWVLPQVCLVPALVEN